MRNRMKAALSREVTMPRWAIALDFVYRAFLVVGAVVVIVLWYQAATRDEEADRNARIQSCTSAYAATTTAWDAQVLSLDERGEALFAELVASSASSDADPDPELLDEYRRIAIRAAAAAEKVDTMARLRIGLAEYAARSVMQGNEFQCPALPDDLMVTPLNP